MTFLKSGDPGALCIHHDLLTMSFHYVLLQKRREKINERLRILQNLVPNGTKVDISTMLEDAVHYVQFLQLQIKVNRVKVTK